MNRYILKITGKRIDTFIMLLVRFNICFRKIKSSKDYIIIEVLEEDYEKLKKIKTTYEIEILKRKGLIYFTHFIKIRKLFIVTILLGFIFLTFLTNIIFDVKVVLDDEELREIILTDLKEFGISKYKFKVSYKEKEKIESKILDKEKELLEWLEIEEKGVNYEVNVIKRVKNKEVKETEPRNIVASKNGMITRIVAETGEVVTKKNNYVNKGDILISGLIKNNDNIVSKVSAKGKVYAEVWYKVSLNLPLTYNEEKRTGNNKNVLEINFLNNDIELTSLDPYKNYKSKKNIIWKHNLLPISLSFTKKSEVELININFEDDLDSVYSLALDKLKKRLGSDIKVIEQKVLKKEKNTDKMDIDIFYKIEEDITSYSSLKDFNIEEENKKNELESE